MENHEKQTISKDCPLPNTHSRLEQAHLLWHQCLDHYFDPTSFKANLNSTIEALRNITFMLQSEKRNIPNFDKWYEDVQNNFKKDPLMAWVSNARTTVVHKSDLEAESWTESVIHNNLELAILKFKIDPFLPFEDSIVFSAMNLPKELACQRDFLVLSIEKKWVINDLPDYEILDALAQVYGKLSKIVAIAHSMSGHVFKTAKIDDATCKIVVNDGRLPCMITTQESRIIRISLKDGTPIGLKIDKASVPLIPKEKIEKRYQWNSESPAAFNGTPEMVADNLSVFAKKVLAKDGHHLRMAFLHFPEGWRFIQISAENRQEKYAAMRILADEARKIQADAIIEISEVWIGPVADFNKGIMPEQSKNRAEALSVTLLKSNGEFKSYVTKFNRNIFNKIKFEETIVDSKDIPVSLSPLMKLWNIKYPKHSVD